MTFRRSARAAHARTTGAIALGLVSFMDVWDAMCAARADNARPPLRQRCLARLGWRNNAHDLKCRQRALLFDIGDIATLAPSNLLHVSHAFVSYGQWIILQASTAWCGGCLVVIKPSPCSVP